MNILLSFYYPLSGFYIIIIIKKIILLEYYNLNIIENIVLFYIYVLFMKKKVEEYFNTNNYIKVIISLNGYININNYSNKEKQAGFLFIFL
ncbi:LOW QUALITY PROTEIN: hypothetical protein PFNF135_05918 [Plasmodium falciparum NF135/5.C10]|uniref:Uncharacterized protein n=1 Tax=Plasmodium falciparum NF135/5.C10 TaxID=1036726 RepID=W4I857_PLAFA|nr:LOW QUALITY PROTEIN: hypothetical protein PFNF135_05918 [Plasmodium falciparum NF135/5.C10]